MTDRRRSRLPERAGLGPGPGTTALVALLAVLGWAGLVRLAVHLGQGARDGGGALGWPLTVLTGVAAAGCLLAALLLLGRVRTLVVRRRALLRPSVGRHRR